jgi:CubicO group peptidase (beta-lactamase class C family)
MASFDVSAWLENDFARLVADRGVPGAAVAVLADGQLHDAAAGVLSLSTGVAATTDSVFQIGSVTKLWTSTLVMQLVDDRLLDLDTPVREYLPEFTTADDVAAASITVRHLLTHTAGFEGDIFDDTGRGDDAVEKLVARMARVPQLVEPGEIYSYNNLGFVVLGRLIEVLRGKAFDQVLTERLTTPLGMTHAAPSPYEAIVHRAAVGHIDTGDGVRATSTWALARSNAPAGAMLATSARDLLAFAKLHLDGGVAADGTRVLGAASAASMLERQVDVPLPSASAWGLGFALHDTDAGLVVGHDGGTIGQGAFLRIVPASGVAVALLTNGGDMLGLYLDVVRHLVEELAGATLRARPTPPAEPAPFDASPYLGTYSDTVYDMVVSQDSDGRVHLDRTPKDVLVEAGERPARMELVRLAPDQLISLESVGGAHSVFAFVGRDDDGRARHIHYGRIISRSTA